MGVKAVEEENEIMVINTAGIIIRMKVSGISVLGRITSGVKLINMGEEVKVASFTKVRSDDSVISEENEKESEDEA